MFLLSRTVRTFGTEQGEKERYQERLGVLRHISIRQAAAYLLYLTSNSALFNLTKVRFPLLIACFNLSLLLPAATLCYLVLFCAVLCCAVSSCALSFDCESLVMHALQSCLPCL